MVNSQQQFLASPTQSLHGVLKIPGDKSISHRSLMLGGVANGITEVRGMLMGEDNLATMRAMQMMGVQIDVSDACIKVHGVGLHGLQKPNQRLDLGNSGTAIRLLTGLLAGQSFSTELMGDESLMRRPMGRVVHPLCQMHAKIDLTPAGTPPLYIHGGQSLKGFHYVMPMASAQVKSSLLLAGLYAFGETCVVESAPTRDHTERMLRTFGALVKTHDNCVSLQGGQTLQSCNIQVPGDISSAAFFIVAATITPGSEIVLQQVGINPTRIGILTILKMMGADIQLENETQLGAEPVADIRVRYAPLKGIKIPQDQVALAIDEFPIIFIAAAMAEGETVLRGAEELRVKESDRILRMAEGLLALGIQAQALPDGLIIEGGLFQGGVIDSGGDHRIAMAFAVAANVALGPITINDCANVATSFPNFVELSNLIGMNVKMGQR